MMPMPPVSAAPQILSKHLTTGNPHLDIRTALSQADNSVSIPSISDSDNALASIPNGLRVEPKIVAGFSRTDFGFMDPTESNNGKAFTKVQRSVPLRFFNADSKSLIVLLNISK